MLELHAGPYQARIESALDALHEAAVVERIWARDHRLWSPEPTEIADRLGWLDSPMRMREQIEPLEALAEEARAAGLGQVALLGMGGSSLAPEMLARFPGPGPRGLPLTVLDSTDPEQVLERLSGLDLPRTLVLVASKSGGTVETLSLARLLHLRLSERLGPEAAGRHFVALTDPGSGLEALAGAQGFRAVVAGDPEIGGRFSALSPFGLLPAALLDIDLATFLAPAVGMAEASRRRPAASLQGPLGLDANPAAILGLALGELALAGRDKLCLLLPPALRGLGDWIEQLVAESTGKGGRGILPVVGEAPWPAARYGDDRVFVELAGVDDASAAEMRAELVAAGHPVLRLDPPAPAELAAQLYLWELATAVAAWRLALNPFDQPDVESAKRSARAVVARYEATGRLEAPAPDRVDAAGHALFGAPAAAASAGEALWRLLEEKASAADYLAVQAWLPQTPATDAALEALRDAVTQATGLVSTLGYGPRFLHSTGQLHKGDAGRGLFLQLLHRPAEDLGIPDAFGSPRASLSFGLLQRAQALGDRAALEDAGRRVLAIRLAGAPEVAIRRLATWRPPAAG